MEFHNLNNPCDCKCYPSTGLDRLLRLQKFEAPKFQDNRHMKVVRLSALCTGHLYPKKTSLLLISVRSRVEPTAIVGLKELSIKNDLTGNEAATFRLVAQCLNQLRYYVFVKVHKKINFFKSTK